MATHWSFPVEDLPEDPRRALPMFLVSPNWKSGVTETLAWLTDVMSSETAVEQRRSLRRYPRRTFEYDFLRENTGRARIENFLAGVGKRDCLVPLWHEQFSLLTTPTDDGVVEFPAGTLPDREFDIGDLVLITTTNFDRYGVLTVVDTNDDVMTVNAIEDIGTWPRGSRIVPLRRAKMLDSVTLDNVTDRVGTTRMRFTLQDADERFSASWGGCAPLWRIKPDRGANLGMEFNRSDFVLDFGSGVIDVTDPGDRAQISQSMQLKFFSRSEVWGFRAFLYNARGRARRFYMPSYTANVEMLGDFPGGDELEAKPNGFSEYFLSPQDARTTLAIDFKDSRPSIYRKIIGVSAILSTTAPFVPVAEQFILEAPLSPILKREVARIGFLVPSRFDQDTIEIFHHVAGSTAVSSSVVVRSVGGANMEPLECWATSLTYPVAAVDAMEVTGELVAGQLYTAAVHLSDALSIEANLVEGTLLRTIAYVTYDRNPPDSIQTTATLIEGTLEQIRLEFETGPESLQTSANLISGTLKRGLITNTIDPDGLQITATFIGGTLT